MGSNIGGGIVTAIAIPVVATAGWFSGHHCGVSAEQRRQNFDPQVTLKKIDEVKQDLRLSNFGIVEKVFGVKDIQGAEELAKRYSTTATQLNEMSRFILQMSRPGGIKEN